MKRFIEGVERTQSVLFPTHLDDYVTEESSVRVIDIFVDMLNLKALGFDGTTPADTGRPSYHPAVLLKIYIYGYLNRIQSSSCAISSTCSRVARWQLTAANSRQ